MQQAMQGFEFNPYAMEVQENPYPFYKVLRDQYPLYWSEKANCWALSRHDDIAAACNEPKRFSSARGNVVDDMPERMGKTLGTGDPLKHDQLRALVNAAFIRGRTLEREPLIRALIVECIHDFVTKGGGDFIKDVTARISAGAICSILGFELGDHVQIKKWSDWLAYRDLVTKELSREGLHARSDLAEYALATINARRLAPRDDLVTALAQAEVEGNKLTQEDLLSTIWTLLAVGIESFSSLMGNAMLALSENLEQYELLGSDLSRAPNAIEELLRYDTPTQRFHCVAAQEIEMYGQRIKIGQSVLVMYGSANRDERKFQDPDCLDITRPAVRHLVMGHGVHHCLGAQLAKAMARIFLEEWYGRVSRVEVQREGIRRVHSPTFRGLQTMPVIVTAK